MIRDWLQKNSIDFLENSAIEGCRYKKLLRFDFVLHLKGDVFCVIEYDGKQHFEKTNTKWSKAFDVQRERDAIKDRFCLENGIPLIRISYKLTDDEIIQRLEGRSTTIETTSKDGRE